MAEGGVFLSGRCWANTITCPGSSGDLALLIPRSPLGALALVSPAAELPGVYSESTEVLVSFSSLLTSSGIYPQWKPESPFNAKPWRLRKALGRKSPTPSKVGVGQSQYFLAPAGVQPPPFSFTKVLAQPHPHPGHFQAALYSTLRGRKTSFHPRSALSVHASSPAWVSGACPWALGLPRFPAATD